MHILQQIEHKCLTYLIIQSRAVTAGKQINKFLSIATTSCIEEEEEVEENETSRGSTDADTGGL